MSGFDISQTAISKAKQLFPTINFRMLDIINDDLKAIL